MNKLTIAFLLLHLLFFTDVAGQENSPNQIFNQYKNGGEVYFRFQQDNNLLTKLSDVVSIDGATNSNWVYAYANQKQFTRFVEIGIEFEMLQHPGTLITPVLKNIVNIKDIEEWDFYPTYEAYIDLMYQFESNYPGLCTVFSIGQSVEGRELLFARISDNASWDAGEAQFLYTSTMHGDETAGYILFLRLIDYLLSNYGTNTDVTNLVDNLDIWINPLANPDGIYAGGNNTINGATRNNANFIDLNRNYPDPEDGQHPDGNDWQAETIAFMELAEENRFVLSANCHSGAEVFNYPWDTWAVLPADNDWWYYVGREWADTVHEHGPAGYFTGLDNGVTNGFQWYSISGGRQDYMNYFQHCREFTHEISNVKVMPESMLPSFWEYNYRSFINYMEQTLYGIRGTVTDSATGQPLSASVLIEGHDIDNSWVGSNPSDGWFFRPVYEGNYSLSFFVPGYASKTLTDISVLNQQATTLDIKLRHTGININENLVSKNFSIGPNPAKDFVYLKYFGDLPAECQLIISNMSGRKLLEESLSFSSVKHTHKINCQAFSELLILIKLHWQHESFTWKVVTGRESK
ncbi:MAG: hypothetical protein K8S16_18405 [Bacteroidales bacterium]|nr:hypothetical protein [Bacteroidales bacterium]